MPFNTATVGAAVAPDVISTFFTHYLFRKPRAQKPTAHISYDEGLSLIRKFLLYASHHTVEDIQRFTAQWVPHPTWVKLDEVEIPEKHILDAADAIQAQLGHRGIEKVGGRTWWQWRRPGSTLKAEWIEMKSDYQERKINNDGGKRVMLYVHGGAYFFGSVDEHRYQMQRHARKLRARVFAPRYRLAPQFPFPCGLLDCLAAYMYLLTVQDPTTIILAGDSAGGGMVLSMLVVMRDTGIPLPAGAVLISPWVDLTHSFPSVAGDNPLDYIPPHGFHQKPSASWPPPNADDMLAMEEGIVKKLAHAEAPTHPQQSEADAIQGFHVDNHPEPGTRNDTAAAGSVNVPTANTVPASGYDLSIMIDDKLVEIKDQIQMYASNQLISHPLVSPVLQPSLGGLPPLLILTGGGEMLRDEQIYLAHKAANPTCYPPGDAFLDDNPHGHNRDQVDRWKPTDVQLQVWEDLCHVAPTLSFTRPAKYMYRSVAQFGAWALARAQKTEIDILDDDDVSVISQSESDTEDAIAQAEKNAQAGVEAHAHQVGKAGDPLPPFKNHMIRQKVDRYGNIFPLEPESELAGCNVPVNEIGVIKQGPVKKWMAAKKEWDSKFASVKRKVQKQRVKEMAKGYENFGGGEVPPPSALAGRRKTSSAEELRERKPAKSMGLSLWSLWGSKHDEATQEREKKADTAPETATASAFHGAGARALNDTMTSQGKAMEKEARPTASRSRSRRRTVTDEHQTEGQDADENTSAVNLLSIQKAKKGDLPAEHLTPAFLAGANDDIAQENMAPPGSAGTSSIPEIRIRTPTDGDDFNRKRPKAGGIAFPFSLKGHAPSASMTTLTSSVGVPPADDIRTNGAMGSGVAQNAKDKKAMADSGDSEDTKVTIVNTPAVMPAFKGSPLSSEFLPADANEAKSTERPALDTFVTAKEGFPTISTAAE